MGKNAVDIASHVTHQDGMESGTPDVVVEEVLAVRRRLAHNVRELRGLHGLSQQELADNAKLSRSTIVRLERMDDTVTLDTLVRLSIAFETSIALLLA